MSQKRDTTGWGPGEIRSERRKRSARIAMRRIFSIIAGPLFIIMVPLLLYIFRDDLAAGGINRLIRRLDSSVSFSGAYDYDDQTSNRYAYIDKYFIVASDAGIRAFDDLGGAKQLTSSLMSDVNMVWGKKNFLIFEQGGKRALLCNTFDIQKELAYSSAIITASMNKNGDFVVISNERGYRAVATVYRPNGDGRFLYKASQIYLTAAAISPSSDRMAAVGFDVKDGIFEGMLKVFRLSSDEDAEAEVSFMDEYPAEVGYFDDGGMYVITDKRVMFLSAKGEVYASFHFGGGRIVLATEDGNIMRCVMADGGDNPLVLLDAKGKQLASRAVAGRPARLSAYNKLTAVLTDIGVTVYDEKLNVLYHDTEYAAAQDMIMTGANEFIAVFSNSARVVIF